MLLSLMGMYESYLNMCTQIHKYVFIFQIFFSRMKELYTTLSETNAAIHVYVFANVHA